MLALSLHNNDNNNNNTLETIQWIYVFLGPLKYDQIAKLVYHWGNQSMLYHCGQQSKLKQHPDQNGFVSTNENGDEIMFVDKKLSHETMINPSILPYFTMVFPVYLAYPVVRTGI